MNSDMMKKKLEEINTKCNEAVKASEDGLGLSEGSDNYARIELCTFTDSMKVEALLKRIIGLGKSLEKIQGKLAYIKDQATLLAENITESDQP